MAITTGDVNLRAENISKIVQGFALQSYKLKQLCMVNSSSAWQETYYRETASELTGGTEHATRGVPRLAQLPYGEVSWTKTSSYIEKFAMEGVLSWEDVRTNTIDVLARTLLRIGRAVAYAVDTQIESSISSNAGNTSAISSGNEWNSATMANRDPVQDLLTAKRLIYEDNYDPDNGNAYVVLNPYDYSYLIGNSKVISNPTFKSADVVTNGVVGEIVGLKIIVTNACTTSQAYVVIAKEALTWKEVLPLTTETIIDPLISYKVRAAEYGVCQAPNVNAMCKITNTRA